MAYNEKMIMEMPTDTKEYLSVEEIAKRFDVDICTVEQLIEANKNVLNMSRHWLRKKVIYFWPDVLRCVKLYTGLIEEPRPSRNAIRRMNRKHRAQLLAMQAQQDAINSHNMYFVMTWVVIYP